MNKYLLVYQRKALAGVSEETLNGKIPLKCVTALGVVIGRIAVVIASGPP
jgi:hypothetical protein